MANSSVQNVLLNYVNFYPPQLPHPLIKELSTVCRADSTTSRRGCRNKGSEMRDSGRLRRWG